MTITLNGTTGITTPDITSSGSLNINASAPDNSLVVNSAGNVGVGTISPAVPLTVEKQAGAGDNGQLLRVTDTNTANSVGPTSLTIGMMNHYAGNPRMSIAGTTGLSFCVGDGSNFAAQRKVEIDSAGRVTMPYQPAFNAIEGNTTGSLIFTQVISNVGNHYSTSTGRFTAPVSGHYLIAFTGGGNSTWGVDVEKNGAKIRRIEVGNPAGFYWSTVCSVIYMVAGDYVNCRAFIGTVSTSAYQGGFSGHLIG